MLRLRVAVVAVSLFACSRVEEPARPPQSVPAAAARRGADLDPGWWARARRSLELDHYRPVVGADGKLRLSALDVRAALTAESVDVSGWSWRTLDVAAATPRIDGQRVRYERGELTEWYEAGPRGIEQGFTVLRVPGRGDLLVRGRVEAEERPVAIEGGLAFGALRYTGLAVRDAEGRALPASMRWDDAAQAVELRVARAALAGAAFPVEIDPLLSPAATVVDPTNQSYSSFGWSVSSAGDVNGDGYGDVVVGAYRFNDPDVMSGSEGGRAYLFLGGPTGMATTPAWAQDPTNQGGANFGISVAGVGDVNGDGYGDVMVGANQWESSTVPSYSNEGRAYLYLGSAAGLSTSPALTLDPTNEAGALFGSVAAAGDVNGDGYADVVVGATGADVYRAPYTNANDGKVFLFLGGPGGLSATPYGTLTATGQTRYSQGAGFGFPLASAGDVNGDGFPDLVVGGYEWSRYVDGGSAIEVIHEGKAWYFQNLGVAPWFNQTQVTELTGCYPQANCYYAEGLSGAGDVNGDGYADVIVGAGRWADSDAGLVADGRAWLHQGGPAGLSVTPAWTMDPTEQTGSWFGSKAAGVGDVNGDGFADVMVSAGYWDDAALATPANAGRAYLYPGGASGLASSPAWFDDPTDRDNSYFGMGLAGAGDVDGDGFGDVIVGAYSWRPAAAATGYEGRAYLYRGRAAGPGATSSWAADPADQTQAALSAVQVGDFDGDGFPDVAVAAPGYGGTSSAEGRVFAFLGSATGMATAPAWTADPADQADARFGEAMAAADFNGDGFVDLLVGAPGFSAGAGKAWLYLGGATGLSTTPAWSASPTGQAGAHFGLALAAAGDVDGDGFVDAVVAAPDWDDVASPRSDEGRVYLFFGGVDGLSLVPMQVFDPADQAGARFGAALAGAFDVDRDGLADVAVGAPGWGGEGRAFLLRGSTSGLTPSAAWTADPADQAGAAFGAALAGGDLDRDGYDDVVVGAPGFGVSAQAGSGKVFAFRGGAAGLEATPAFSLAPLTQAAAAFGAAVRTADPNGDGFADVVVAAPGLDGTAAGEGRVFVFEGSAAGPTSSAAWSAEPADQAQARFGSGLASADLNGDGFSDLLASAPAWGTSYAGEGRVWLYPGGDGAVGLARGLRQFLADGTTPVRRGGRALQGPVVFSGRVTQEGPVGGLLRLQVEVKAVGTAFDGTSLSLSPPFKGGEQAKVSVALGAGPYHWRARVVYPVGLGYGRWTSYGGNAEVEADVIVGRSNGEPCSMAADCRSTFCVDSVCCNGACGGGSGLDCQACSVVQGGVATGHCTASAVGWVCQASQGACDEAQRCDGVSLTCPNDTGTCDDNDVCTSDSCPSSTCSHAPIADCCVADEQCNDADPCTADVCTGHACTHALAASCPGDAGTDAGLDAGVDAGADAGNGGADAGWDAGNPGADAGRDAGSGGADAGLDAGNAGADAGLDAGTDAGWDAGTDAGNAGSDAGLDAGVDAGWDAGSAGADAGWDAGTDAGSAGGPDASQEEPPTTAPVGCGCGHAGESVSLLAALALLGPTAMRRRRRRPATRGFGLVAGVSPLGGPEEAPSRGAPCATSSSP